MAHLVHLSSVNCGRASAKMYSGYCYHQLTGELQKQGISFPKGMKKRNLAYCK
jgi:hypothetical protein